MSQALKSYGYDSPNDMFRAIPNSNQFKFKRLPVQNKGQSTSVTYSGLKLRLPHLKMPGQRVERSSHRDDDDEDEDEEPEPEPDNGRDGRDDDEDFNDPGAGPSGQGQAITT